MEFSNCRPVSVLPILSQVFERSVIGRGMEIGNYLPSDPLNSHCEGVEGEAGRVPGEGEGDHSGAVWVPGWSLDGDVGAGHG